MIRFLCDNKLHSGGEFIDNLRVTSKKISNDSALLTKEELILGSFFDCTALDKYRQGFNLVYYKIFGEFSSEPMKFSSRCTHELLLYHSLSNN